MPIAVSDTHTHHTPDLLQANSTKIQEDYLLYMFENTKEKAVNQTQVS